MKKFITSSCLATIATLATATALSTSALAQSIAINGGKVVTNTLAGTFDDSNLLIENGRVTSVSTDTPYEGDNVITTEDLWVTPGIFAPYTQLGLVEVSAVKGSNNIRADKVDATVRVRAADSFNPKASNIAVSRRGGITHAAVFPSPSTDIFGGIGMVVSTDGTFNSTLNDQAFIYVDYSGSSEKTGGTAGAAMAYLRSALDDARNFSTRFGGPTDGDTLRRADAEALRPAVQGQLPLFVAVDRAVDINNIIKLKSEFPNMKVTLVSAAEAWVLADELAQAGIGVMVDPMTNLPFDFDYLAANLDNINFLTDAGVQTAIISVVRNGGTAHNLRAITQTAGNAVSNGLSWDKAFKAISLTPAAMFGQPNLGQIEIGQTANLVVWDGDPLEVTSAPIAVIIDGKLQSLSSRQTELRDRYNPTRTDDVPYGYPTP